MKIIAFYTLKGGAGKTTCAVNLAYLAAQQHGAVLLWDLEPQGASSFYFRVKPKLKGGCEALLSGKRDLDSYIKGSDFAQLDILPADFSCRNMDLLLEEYKKPKKRLRKLLDPLAGQYAYVFLDCPPTGSLLAEAVIDTADAILAPLPATSLARESLWRLQQFIADREIDPGRLLPFLSLLDRRKPLHRKLEAELRADCPELLTTAIPYAPIVEHMAAERLPLGAFAPNVAVAGEYAKLWREVQGRLGSAADAPSP